MSNPWEIYDRLISEIPDDVQVVSIIEGPKWWQLASSAGGAGMAFYMPVESIPRQKDPKSLIGAPLREVATLAKSWNFAEAGLGMAAINSWHSDPKQATKNGFTPLKANNFGKLFDPWNEVTAGKKVAVIGHFPFAPEALNKVAELLIFERNLWEGDYPDSAAEYLLPDCDYVFISGSAFVNKTAPRLFELSADAVSIVVGPSTPASAILFDYGLDGVLPFVCADGSGLQRGIAGELPGGMYEVGQRMAAFRPGYEAPPEPVTPEIKTLPLV
ncbi:MAG: hypothetical protein CSA83_00830 [Actinomycetales bacterium]|nr:MAG: hypothetical protein CSA83_00830 [Actinomycetales bacterium]